VKDAPLQSSEYLEKWMVSKVSGNARISFGFGVLFFRCCSSPSSSSTSFSSSPVLTLRDIHYLGSLHCLFLLAFSFSLKKRYQLFYIIGVRDVQTNVEMKSVIVQTDDQVSPQLLLEKLKKVGSGRGMDAFWACVLVPSLLFDSRSAESPIAIIACISSGIFWPLFALFLIFVLVLGSFCFVL
jgi:hypothetical protein